MLVPGGAGFAPLERLRRGKSVADGDTRARHTAGRRSLSPPQEDSPRHTWQSIVGRGSSSSVASASPYLQGSNLTDEQARRRTLRRKAAPSTRRSARGRTPSTRLVSISPQGDR